jgi:hypothetical protein
MMVTHADDRMIVSHCGARVSPVRPIAGLLGFGLVGHVIHEPAELRHRDLMCRQIERPCNPDRMLRLLDVARRRGVGSFFPRRRGVGSFFRRVPGNRERDPVSAAAVLHRGRHRVFPAHFVLATDSPDIAMATVAPVWRLRPIVR